MDLSNLNIGLSFPQHELDKLLRLLLDDVQKEDVRFRSVATIEDQEVDVTPSQLSEALEAGLAVTVEYTATIITPDVE